MTRHAILTAAIVILVAFAALASSHDVRAIPFFHVAGDSDGDHVIDGADLQPAVYCRTSHADVNSNGTTNSIDLALAATMVDVFPMAPADALKDQNHNDAGDIMDVSLIAGSFGSVGTACTSLVPSPLPDPDLGSTAGPGFLLLAPTAVVPGPVTVTLRTSIVSPTPFQAYWLDITFDAAVVTATGATPLVGGGCSGPFIDNTPDINGNGEVRFGCSSFAPTAAVTLLADVSFLAAAPGNPQFCGYPFEAPYGAPAALTGTYTVGSDIAPQTNPQTNSDANFIDLSPPLGFDDLTWINSDPVGDACDSDADNDGLSNAAEAAGCGFGPTDPLLRDSDNDRTLDGAECAIGTNPNNGALRPTVAQCVAAAGAASMATDTDADGVKDYIEYCNYNSSLVSVNTDGDACGDRREVASVNNDLSVTAADLGIVAGAFGAYAPGSYRVDLDANKDGAITAGDLGFTAAAFGACP